VRVVLEAEVDAEPDAAVRVLGDLTTYPKWLSIVQRVELIGVDTWLVDIGARVGLLRQTKRVRMVRTGPLRFERDEADGAQHPPWILDATVDGRTIRVELSYGGSSVLVHALEPLLRVEAARAPARLRRLLHTS
jgi:hypothetical protein